MRGSERCFVDTNVLLYAVDPADPAKQRAANGWLTVLWETSLGCLSWQVLNEFYVNAVRKGRTANRKARRVVEVYATWPLVGAITRDVARPCRGANRVCTTRNRSAAYVSCTMCG